MPSNKFRIQAIPRQIYEPLLGLSDPELAHHHARWIVADAEQAYLCRVSLQDARRANARNFTFAP